jgi:hypothetical protein
VFDERELLGQLLVFDRVADPARVVAATKVVDPGLVVDALGELEEQLRFWARRASRPWGPRK